MATSLVGKFPAPGGDRLVPISVNADAAGQPFDKDVGGNWCKTGSEAQADQAYKERLMATTSLSQESEVTWKGKDPYVTRLVASTIKVQAGGSMYRPDGGYRSFHPGDAASRLGGQPGGKKHNPFNLMQFGPPVDSAGWDLGEDTDPGPMV